MSELNISSVLAGVDATRAAGAALRVAGAGARDVGGQAKIEKVAKDFESVLLGKVMEEMRRSVPDSGLLDSNAQEQTQGIFWMELSQELARQGGLGLWKQLAKQMQTAGTSVSDAGELPATQREPSP